MVVMMMDVVVIVLRAKMAAGVCGTVGACGDDSVGEDGRWW